jgi:hypothetical protein
METIEGFDFLPLVFEKDGALQDPDELDALIEHVVSAPATDVIFIAHGFRNDVGQSTRLYTDFLKNFRNDLARPSFREVADRSFVVAGVYWPSKAFRETFGESAEGTRSLQNPALAMADAKEQLEELKKDATPAQRRSLDKAAALLPKLEGNPECSRCSHGLRSTQQRACPRSASTLARSCWPGSTLRRWTERADCSARSPGRWGSSST